MEGGADCYGVGHSEHVVPYVAEYVEGIIGSRM
jgi:hypothetical protein